MATLGNTSGIDYSYSLSQNDAAVLLVTVPDSYILLSDFQSYSNSVVHNGDNKAVIWDSLNNVIENGVSEVYHWSSSGWHSYTFSTWPTLVKNESYYIGIVSNDSVGASIRGQLGGGFGFTKDSSNSYASPTTLNRDAETDYDLAIYITYTEVDDPGGDFGYLVEGVTSGLVEGVDYSNIETVK